MRLLVVALALFAPWNHITGRVEKLGSRELRVNGQRIIVTDKTAVIKGRTVYDLSPLSVGEQVRVDVYFDAANRAVAKTISTKATVAGTIVQYTGELLLIRPAPKRVTVEPRSLTTVYLHPYTVFGSPPRQLKPGAEVEVIGWDIGSGEIDAARVAVYNTDVPVLKPDQ